MKRHVTSLAEAKKKRYGRWAGHPLGRPYLAGSCAWEVFPANGGIQYQCTRNNGHGPEKLFCKQHAKKTTSTQD